MALEWKQPIRCYVSPAGNNKVRQWYDELSSQEKADADEFLRIMQKTSDWSMPHYRPKLSGIQKTKKLRIAIGELRWQSENVQHRLIGFFKDDIWYALIGCTHKAQVYSPADALNTAATRASEILHGRVVTAEYDI